MTTDRTGLLFEADFNSGSDVTAMGFKYSGNPSSITDMNGERGVKLTLDHYGSNSYNYRTEIQPNKLPSSDFTSGMFAKMGGEFWYGLRTYMPDSWKQVDKSDTIITQWHAQPDSGNPPVALQTKYVNGEQHYNLIIRSNPSGDGTNGFKYIKQIDLGKIDGDIGKWTDWAWHIKWSPNGDGFLELFKDGQKVVDFDGGTCYVDDAGPYMKIGLYKYDWHSSTDTGPDSRTLYVDSVRVGDDAASYSTVIDTASSVTAPLAPAPDQEPALTATGTVATSGNDVLIGGDAADVMSGGAGQDTLAAGQGDDKVYGNGGDDVLFGGAGLDTLGGGQGDDVLHGGWEGDVLYGDRNNDVLFGEEGDDRLFGGQGSDVVIGGDGADILTGGPGRDQFVVGAPGTGVDRIADFSVTADRLDLSAVRTTFEAATGIALTAEHLAFIQTGSGTEVRVDADGAGSGGFATVCVLDGVTAGDLDLGTNVVLHDGVTDAVI